MSEHKWCPITDLPADFGSLTDGELASLLEVWKDQRGLLDEEGLLATFNAQLQRKWAIETGVIERVYSLDRGVTETLIKRGIDASWISHDATDKDPVLVARIIQDHADVLEGLFTFVKGERPLTVGYVKELHAALLRHQSKTTVMDQFGNLVEIELEKGAYKTQPNNPRRPDDSVYEYCPPEHAAAEMDRLIAWHHDHMAKDVPPEVEAAWLHHRFTQIHPFTDGNGRVARALASLVFLKAGWFPVVITRDDREMYIDALEIADLGDLRPLIDQFVRKQTSSFIDLLSVRDAVKPPENLAQAIATTREVLVRKGRISDEKLNSAKSTTVHLNQVAAVVISQAAERIRSELGNIDGIHLEAQFSREHPDSEIVQASQQLGNVPNLSQYKSAVTLEMRTSQLTSIVVAFHGLGRVYHGVLAAIMFMNQNGKLTSVAGTFQINYRERVEQAESRFRSWLDKGLTQALLEWRETL
jgi:Fic family protein